MRLIDIERLVKEYITSNKDLTKVTYYDIRKYEVKAIPIDWIKERLNKAVAFTHSKAEGNIIDDGCVVSVVSASFTANVLLNLLEDWKKENEDIRG